jgi:hypothetical protein
MIRLPKSILFVLAFVMVVALALPVLADDAKGRIKSVDPNKNEFVLTDSNNKDWTFQLDSKGKVFINNKEGKLADLQAADDASVTYQKQGDKLSASAVRATRK